jgi:hypothetical protein
MKNKGSYEMNSIERIFCIPISLFLIFLLTYTLKAQPKIDLPKEIHLEINESDLPLTSDWIDSLIDEAFEGKIYYKIIAVKKAEYWVTTHIQLPQILSLNEVLRQIVLYYTLLPTEEIRERELLNIFPYFESVEGDPSLKCQYSSEGKFYIELDRWNRVPVPTQPIIEDREIFNQIIQASFFEVQSFGDVPEKIFEKVAVQNNLSMERIRIIYQNTILWQLGNQLDSK